MATVLGVRVCFHGVFDTWSWVCTDRTDWMRDLFRTRQYSAFGKSLCTYKRCWKWCPRASIQAWTGLTKITYSTLSLRLFEHTVLCFPACCIASELYTLLTYDKSNWNTNDCLRRSASDLQDLLKSNNDVGSYNACLKQVLVFVWQNGFGGLVVSMLASGTQVRRFKPGWSRWLFRA
jgi:hypothetical protein